MVSASGAPVPVVGLGASCGGVKRGGGNLPDSGFCGRSFGGGSVLVYLGGNAGQVAAAPKGVRT